MGIAGMLDFRRRKGVRGVSFVGKAKKWQVLGESLLPRVYNSGMGTHCVTECIVELYVSYKGPSAPRVPDSDLFSINMLRTSGGRWAEGPAGSVIMAQGGLGRQGAMIGTTLIKNNMVTPTLEGFTTTVFCSLPEHLRAVNDGRMWVNNNVWAALEICDPMLQRGEWLITGWSCTTHYHISN